MITVAMELHVVQIITVGRMKINIHFDCDESDRAISEEECDKN